ncbi:MAG: GNAT family N-acetyltransferase [Dehalococcoidia bacterium]
MAFERTREPYRISTDPELLDLDVIHGFLKGAYWSPGVPRQVIERAIEGSLNFGLYRGDEQIGFARVCTDRATFAYLMDVFVLPEHRGNKLSVWLMETVMAHPDLQDLRIFRLATRDAHSLYEKVGFSRIANPDAMMEITRPDMYLTMEQQP